MSVDFNTMSGLLDDLWLSTVQELIGKVKDHSASPTDIGNAIKLLRDNGIVMNAKQGKQTLEEMIQEMTATGGSVGDYIDGKLQIEVTDLDLEEDEIRQ